MGTSYDRYQKLQLKWILLTWPRVDFGERDQIIVRSLDFQFRHTRFYEFFPYVPISPYTHFMQESL